MRPEVAGLIAGATVTLSSVLFGLAAKDTNPWFVVWVVLSATIVVGLALRAYPTRLCDAGSFLKDLLPHERCPHAAGRRRGGDGEWATCPTTGDDLANSGGA